MYHPWNTERRDSPRAREREVRVTRDGSLFWPVTQSPFPLQGMEGKIAWRKERLEGRLLLLTNVPLLFRKKKKKAQSHQLYTRCFGPPEVASPIDCS